MYRSDVVISEDENDAVLANIIYDIKNPQDETPKSVEDFKNLPLVSQSQIETAKQCYLKMPHGIHHWNAAVIEKRRFELILPVSVS